MTCSSTWRTDPVAIYNESGLTLDLPDGRHFRFADLPAYKLLSGQNLREMDFAWVDAGKLFLLEVRSYAQVSTTLTGADFVPVKGQAADWGFAKHRFTPAERAGCATSAARRAAAGG